MKKQIKINKSRKPDEWFDWECKVARKNVRRLLKKFRRSLPSEDRNSFCIGRREYKNMLKRKKVDFNAVLLDRVRKTFGKLYTRYRLRESQFIIIFLWVVGFSVLGHYLKKMLILNMTMKFLKIVKVF